VISESIDGERLLLGEVKWSAKPFDRRALAQAVGELAARPAPPLPPRYENLNVVRALFVPEIAGRAVPETQEGVMVVTLADLFELDRSG
jgi:hypothetical protein